MEHSNNLEANLGGVQYWLLTSSLFLFFVAKFSELAKSFWKMAKNMCFFGVFLVPKFLQFKN